MERFHIVLVFYERVIIQLFSADAAILRKKNVLLPSAAQMAQTQESVAYGPTAYKTRETANLYHFFFFFIKVEIRLHHIVSIWSVK